MFANENLYLLNHPENMHPAQVVFTTEEGVENLNEFLSELAEQLREFQPEISTITTNGSLAR